jgi:isocitrate/isopropylmalate dehydrogenase
MQHWICGFSTYLGNLFRSQFPQEYALFEPGCRHVASDIMGTNRANPTAMILSATMLLRHLG